MKICVYGAGAIGGLIAARLAQAGHEVSVVARGAQLTAIVAHGLRIVSAGKETATRLKANNDPGKLGPQDYVIVAVKGHSLPEVAAGIAPLLGEGTSIVTAMNGVPWWFFDRLAFGGGKLRLESLDPGGGLAQAMPTGRIVGCVVHVTASAPAPGLIHHHRNQRLIVGEPGGKNSARTGRLAAALRTADFEVEESAFIEKDSWVKLLGNISANPVSALTLANTDRMLADEQVRAYMVAIMRECLAIGRAVGVDAGIETEARIDMARKLGAFKTSMLQDMEAGKRLEIDTLLTGTLEIAKKAGVAAPFTESLAGLIRLRVQSG
ncbi:MAG: 2-dehydropantoate 2-reductase [Burkholderiales bacterium]|nr:2-dehydropantoate 2-reductase [Burkholderiales bacterium]